MSDQDKNETVTTVPPVDGQGPGLEVKWSGPITPPETPAPTPPQEPGSPVTGWSGPITPEASSTQPQEPVTTTVPPVDGQGPGLEVKWSGPIPTKDEPAK